MTNHKWWLSNIILLLEVYPISSTFIGDGLLQLSYIDPLFSTINQYYPHPMNIHTIYTYTNVGKSIIFTFPFTVTLGKVYYWVNPTGPRPFQVLAFPGAQLLPCWRVPCSKQSSCEKKTMVAKDMEPKKNTFTVPFIQGLVNVPFWEYWTSPYSSHYRLYT